MTAEERIAEVQKSAIPARLLNGAPILGKLWRDRQRCSGGWSALCPCDDEKETLFCQAKERWVGLLREFNPPGLAELHEADPFFIIKAMTVSMFEASQLTATISIPGTEKPIKVGPGMTALSTLISLAGAVADGAPLAKSWNQVASVVEGLSQS
jgi:hypothetical protein